MCRISDFLIPKRAEERAEVGWGEIKEERSKRRIIVMALAKEELKDSCFDRKKKFYNFFL